MKNCFYICMYIVIGSMLFRISMEGFQFLCFYFKSDTKLKEYTIDEKEVSKILLQVAVARREAEIVSCLVFTLHTSIAIFLNVSSIKVVMFI